VCIYDS